MLYWSTCGSIYLSDKLICKTQSQKTRNAMTITNFCHTLLCEHMCICMAPHARSLLTFWINSSSLENQRFIMVLWLCAHVLLEAFDSETRKKPLSLTEDWVCLSLVGSQWPSIWCAFCLCNSSVYWHPKAFRSVPLGLAEACWSTGLQHELTEVAKIHGYTFILISWRCGPDAW